MKTVIVTIEGEVRPGDYIGLCYRHPRFGGQSVIGLVVPEPRDSIATGADGTKHIATSTTTIADIVRFWKNEVDGGKAWVQNEIQATIRNEHQIILKCSDALTESEFYATLEGKGGTEPTALVKIETF